MANKKLRDRVAAAACGCGAHQKSRKALAVDPEIKSSNLKMKNHLRHCASDAIRDKAPGRAETMYEELLNLMEMQSR
jgi:hypothetical protein